MPTERRPRPARRSRPSALLAVLVLSGAGCDAPERAGEAGPGPASHLFVWAGDLDGRASDTDFLAVYDIGPDATGTGQVVSTAPIGAVHVHAHHTELNAPGDFPLFASGFMAGKVWLFDLKDPAAPQVSSRIDSVPGFKQPHSFARLPDGNVLATLQFGDGSRPGNPGGLGLFAPDGTLLRTVSSEDPAFPDARIRTYALDVANAGDRTITTSSPMTDEQTTHVVQIWRTSDLSLLRTLAVPEVAGDTLHHRMPFEVRFLDGGSTALLNTFMCGFYLLRGVDGDNPAMERVLALDDGDIGCSVPLVMGHYWIMPIMLARKIVVLNIADPSHPTVVATVATDSTFGPHWSSRDPGSDRVAFTSVIWPEMGLHGDPRILIARFDSTTGALTWDARFSDPATGRLGIDLGRADWPHGATGPAMPHGVFFRR